MNEKILEAFSICDRKIKSGEDVDCMVILERDMGIDYRDLKDIILTFYEEGRFVDVCKAYVKQVGKIHGNVSCEYNEIMDDILREEGEIK